MLDELNENQLNPVLEMLKKALNGVENQYIEQHYVNPHVNYIQKPERVFVAELYHQLRTIQNAHNFGNLYFNVDLNKRRSMPLNEPCFPENPFKKISPDIVLHNGQSNTLNQKLVCEVKMEGISWKSMEKDLRKLIFYKLDALEFENAVFIFTGSKALIENYLDRIVRVQGLDSLIDCLHKHCILFALPKSKENNTYQWGIYAID
jgi:hypothetical protein